MSKNKLEVKILKDSKDAKADLDSMPLEVANAFLVLLQSFTRIGELSASKKDVKISVTKGSVAISMEGTYVEKINNNFNEVVENKSTDKELVEQWRNIQSLFSSNGLSYEAFFYTKENTKVGIYDILKNKSKIRTKRVLNPPIKTHINFFEGKLMAVGGKFPNIHVETAQNEKLVIDCTEMNAKKAIKFLYSEILISVLEIDKNGKKEFALCDSYAPSQSEIYNEFRIFIYSINNADDEIESLRRVHYQCRKYLDEKEYGKFRKFLRLFANEHTDINILNTILIVSQAFKAHELLTGGIQELHHVFVGKLNNLNRNKGGKKN